MLPDNPKKPTILYVDDEAINLDNFQRTFERDFTVLIASSGKEALEIFKAHMGAGVAVVVSDQRMPGLSGSELLSQIYKLNPDPCRIILTGYTDFEDLSDGINKGHIYSWIQKPWEYRLLKPVLLRAVESYQITVENKRLIKSLSEKNIQLKEELILRERAENKRREAEIKMLAQSKLASIGEMATGIAHEINQPLTYIKILLEATRRDFEENTFDPIGFINEEIPEGLRQISRIAVIIDHMRSFGRKSSKTMQAVELKEIVHSTLIPLRQRLLSEGIELTIDLGGQDSVSTFCNPLRIEQVLVNLVVNSIDALQDKKDDKRIKISARTNGDTIELSFFDNGCGMTNKTREKIFEPFFTTKEIGRGTGIGLSISYGIINEHKGRINCESQPGEGTTFIITLPISNERT